MPRGGGQYLVGHPYRIAGHTYVPAENTSYTAVGMASWYGAAFHGRRTANGEGLRHGFDHSRPSDDAAAELRPGNESRQRYSVIVRVNDRGPYHGGRVMDVSSRTADVLDFKGAGTAKIKVEYVGHAPMDGSDDRMLLASLRTDGSPANIDGYSAPAETMVADAGSSVFGALFFVWPVGAAAGRPARARAAADRPAGRPAPRRSRSLNPSPLRSRRWRPPLRRRPDRPPTRTQTPRPSRRGAVAVRQPHGPIPLPPSRPFDLGEIRATIQVASTPRARPQMAAVLPPRKPRPAGERGKGAVFLRPSA